MLYYSFTWHQNDKYVKEPVERTHLIMTPESPNARLNAIAVFRKTFGSAKKALITSIQELQVVRGHEDKAASAYNQYLEPVGEPFMPDEVMV